MDYAEIIELLAVTALQRRALRRNKTHWQVKGVKVEQQRTQIKRKIPTSCAKRSQSVDEAEAIQDTRVKQDTRHEEQKHKTFRLTKHHRRN